MNHTTRYCHGNNANIITCQWRNSWHIKHTTSACCSSDKIAARSCEKNHDLDKSIIFKTFIHGEYFLHAKSFVYHCVSIESISHFWLICQRLKSNICKSPSGCRANNTSRECKKNFNPTVLGWKSLFNHLSRGGKQNNVVCQRQVAKIL